MDASGFSAAFIRPSSDNGRLESGLIISWVQTRGRLEKGSGDSGKDLVMMREGGFPEVLLSGVAGLSEAVFSPSGVSFAVQTKDALLLGDTADLSTRSWVTLRAGESFAGRPTWVREESVLFAVSGGEPKRDRLFMHKRGQIKSERGGPLFVAAHGGALLNWDHSQDEDDAAHIAVVHRLPDAMLAEIVLMDHRDRGLDDRSGSKVVAVDCRQEYCTPQVGFLAPDALDGPPGPSLLLRLNALPLLNGGHLCDAERLKTLPKDAVKEAVHGLWLIEDLKAPRLSPVHMGPPNRIDVFSGSYGRPGAAEGFRLDPSRCRVFLSARTTGTEQQADGVPISYSDDLYELSAAAEGDGSLELLPLRTATHEGGPGKGCKIPVAYGETGGDRGQGEVLVVYHHRSPTARGDLWLASQSKPNRFCSWRGGASGREARLTKTMPLSLQRKLLTPTEVMVRNEAAPHCGGKALPIHALRFAPEGDGPLQPLLWLHGGPMCQLSFDYNPLLSWLASCGYLVLAPNFSGSTGNGLGFMNRVMADGCGVADLSDCLACAEYLKTEARKVEPRLDTSRGVAVAGHSWGGYLASMCLLQHVGGESVFSCGVSMAGIADWYVQQRHTEVRYYDYALMGGWVYEKEVAARAREASPITRAAELRAPILVLHGDKDIDVPFQQVPPFVEALRRSTHGGAAVEYHAYPGEGHGIAGTEAQADVLDRLRTFLRVNLKPWDFTDNPHGEVAAY